MKTKTVVEFPTVETIDTKPLRDLMEAWDQLAPGLQSDFFDYLHAQEGIIKIGELVKSTPHHKEYMKVLERKIELEHGLEPFLKKS